jgi:hypothetical protein
VSERLFLSLVPHSSDEGETRRDRSFCYTKEETSDEKTGEGLDCGVAAEDDGPGETTIL